VDTEHHLIVTHEVTNTGADRSWRGEKTSAALVQANADKTDRPIACGSCGNHRSCIIFELDGPRSVPAAEPSAYQYIS
jgi:hypothetical protein